jgi:hypothetical protein
MTTNLDRLLENIYISSYFELTEFCLEIPFNSVWIYDLNPNKKIGIRRIDAEGDPGGSYPFNLQIGYSTKQYGIYYIYNIQIDLNLRTQKTPDIVQIIVNRIKSWEYSPSDIDASFDYEDTYGYLNIHSTMPAGTSFPFYLMSDWTNDYFSLPDDIIIDSISDTIEVYSFKGKNYYSRLHELDLYHRYFH